MKDLGYSLQSIELLNWGNFHVVMKLFLKIQAKVAHFFNFLLHPRFWVLMGLESRL